MNKQIIKPNFSFWEIQTYFKNIDLIVIGSGIVGLNAALSYKQKYKKSKVVILERGILPSGASTKNAGFACFGSPSELLSDIKNTGEELVWQTVEMRIKGLELLRKRLGDKQIDYKEFGGYELFDKTTSFQESADALAYLNKSIRAFTKTKEVYRIEQKKIDRFKFKGIKGLILNKKEGQIDTGLMMKNLIELAIGSGILILNSVEVNQISDSKELVSVSTSLGAFQAKKIIVATNGFANELLKLKDLKPARAQVLVTKPIKGLALKGTFHYDEGYYYFRNINNRVLFGGGRNLDFKGETTTKLGLNTKIQAQLTHLLKTMILPDIPFEIEQQWSGIMGIGSEKKPIIKKISPNIICAVRMGGMGIAIGSLVGNLAVDELE